MTIVRPRFPHTGEAADYAEMLHALADASVTRGFSPYRDIDWDAPEFEVVPNDPRWILPETDLVGRHPWYRAQSRDAQIRIGMYRQAAMAKVGLQFEQLLMSGVMLYLLRLPNGSAEFRYATHEVIEECNHTLMFQQAVNRSGVDVPGFDPWFQRLAPLIPLLARISPTFFFICILAGEEPIDHIQKAFLRGEPDDYHPILEGVMRIHVAEEARHISFAHEFIRRHAAAAGPVARATWSILLPVAMRVACELIVPPPAEFWRKFDIPAQVRRDLFWGRTESCHELAGYFGDVRALAAEAGLLNPVADLVWKALRIAGPPSRYRGEPNR
ncbi:AurF N-oxygenase family protein [Nocardia stercoris]|uniref:Diiron oxygenase n=1 Tax=Nocardia stercoris TaxID=2483361 RepID=A0A3M2KWU3_9NOCA|nr:diiron oxygenase [Nocardia stercoris]RMI29711.1 diiron oxygenase [Nocardia stercoris]